MAAHRFTLFPRGEPEQELRLRRFFLAAGAYAMNSSFVLACWWMGYFPTQAVGIYLTFVAAIHLGVYLTIRTGLNKRLPDPSMTDVQMTVAMLSGLYLMYYASDFRSTFLLLGVAMLVFGMFRYKTRGIAYFGAFILACYGAVIGLLLLYRPHEINLKVEALQWIALFVTLAQFSYIAGYIGNLRRKLHISHQEMAKRNEDLQAALQRISDMAIRDELTGVHNRRYLTERIDEEAYRCARNGGVFCVCIVDVDFFKKINDVYGHMAGDDVLRKVAATAAGTLRQTDFFGRFGGEEFVMVTTDTDIAGALIVAERVRQKIEQLSFPDLHPELKVTVSIGIAEHVRRTDTAVTFKYADEALYRAKESGRNKCVAADRTAVAAVAAAG